MQFIKHDLGQLAGGEVVEVTLTDAAYVRLMDSANFRKYRSLHRHNSYGGRYDSSPVRLRVPYAGHWIVAVDLAGYEGRVGASARVLPVESPQLAPMPVA